MNRKQWVIELIAKQAQIPYGVAESVVDRLTEEGVLHLGHGNADIDIVVEQFQEIFGTTKVSRYDRWAANRLVAKYGTQSVVGILQLLGKYQQERYAPVVNSLAQLEEKMPSVLNFLRKQNDNTPIDA